MACNNVSCLTIIGVHDLVQLGARATELTKP